MQGVKGLNDPTDARRGFVFMAVVVVVLAATGESVVSVESIPALATRNPDSAQTPGALFGYFALL
jgi:hypothetical protein